MSFSSIKLSRDELYKKVWEQPVSVLAKGYGISDVGLAKMCRRLDIPLPGLGYWAKKQHGKRVKQTPLPAPPADMKLEVTIISYRKVAADPEQLQMATYIIDAEELEANAVLVPEVLADPHPTVVRSLKLLDKKKPGADGLVQVSDAACLPIAVSSAQLDRALRIMDTLLKAFAARGYAFAIEGGLLRVEVAGEPINCFLREDLDKMLKPMTPRQQEEFNTFGWRSRPDYYYSPSGTIALHAAVTVHNGLRRRWSDNSRRPLERVLNSFLAGIVKLAVAVRADRLDRERRDRQWKDIERRREELRAAQQREKERLTLLDREVVAWNKAEEIRAYVDRVRQLALKKYEHIEPGSDIDNWITWASGQADRHDPLVKSPPSVLDEELPPYTI